MQAEDGIIHWYIGDYSDKFGLEIYVGKNEKGNIIDEWVKEKEKTGNIKIKEIILDNSKAVILKTSNSIEENNNILADFIHGEYIFSVGFVVSVEDLEKILSTFKFTE